MAARASGGVITLGVFNIIVAIVPVCAGCFGTLLHVDDRPQPMIIQNRDVGPQFKAHIDRQVPHAKFEAFGAAGGNACFCLLLLVGAIGLFMNQNWARWLCVGTSVFLILTLCVHDIYQLGIYRPAVDSFLDVQLRGMPDAEKTGFKIGFSGALFFWSCVNPLIMVYLVVMALCLAMSSSFDSTDDDRPRRRRDRRDDDDDDDDDDPRPRRRKRGYDDDDDDDRYEPRSRRRRRRGDDDDY